MNKDAAPHVSTTTPSVGFAPYRYAPADAPAPVDDGTFLGLAMIGWCALVIARATYRSTGRRLARRLAAR